MTESRSFMQHGKELSITEYLGGTTSDMVGLLDVDKKELLKMLEESKIEETVAYHKIKRLVNRWRKAAWKTKNIRAALAVQKHKVEHTNNKWITEDDKIFIRKRHRSNFCFVESYHMTSREYPRISGQKEDSQLFMVTHLIETRSPLEPQIEKKTVATFWTQEQAEQHLEVLIDSYDYLFQDEVPEIPEEFEKAFCISGYILLPGYRRTKEDITFGSVVRKGQ